MSNFYDVIVIGGGSPGEHCAGALGMIYFDVKTQKHTPKLSAAWYLKAAARNVRSM